MSAAIFPLTAFLLVTALIPLARRLALKVGYVDAPGGRKQHKTPVPPIGGLIIFPVFIAVSCAAGFTAPAHAYFYIALSMIVVLGALDDRAHLPAGIKFFIQIVAAAMLVWAGPGQVHQLGDLFGRGDVGLSVLWFPFSMAAIVLLINAVNLMDGLDGLAGGLGVIALGWLLMALAASGIVPAPGQPVSILLAALLGFLIYNLRHPFRQRASVFLGDAGSLGLGLCLACFCIDLAQAPAAVLKPISVAWILALPIIDVCAQFYRRVREGRHPFDPDRGHFHHHLIHAGFSVRQAVLILYALSVMCGVMGVMAYRYGAPQWTLALAWTLLLLVHLHLSRKPEIYTRFFARLRA